MMSCHAKGIGLLSKCSCRLRATPFHTVQMGVGRVNMSQTADITPQTPPPSSSRSAWNASPHRLNFQFHQPCLKIYSPNTQKASKSFDFAQDNFCRIILKIEWKPQFIKEQPWICTWITTKNLAIRRTIFFTSASYKATRHFPALL